MQVLVTINFSTAINKRDYKSTIYESQKEIYTYHIYKKKADVLNAI